MIEDLHAVITALKGDDEAHAVAAFAAIAEMARSDPGKCAVELSRAILAEQAAGALRTPRLLTLLGLTRVPVPECLPVCLNVLRALAAMDRPPAHAALGAAAIIARTQPRALLPDVESTLADPQAAQAFDHEITRPLMLLLSITSEWLGKAPDSVVADMARWLWCDCAAFDLMTLADFACLRVKEQGADDRFVGLMVDLLERVPATADQKGYAVQRLQEAGAGAVVMEQLQTACRAIRVAPVPEPATIGPSPVVDPEPPAPDPRVDEWLAAFSEGDEYGIELARAAIDEMFEYRQPPDALAWWVAVTVDALSPRRRRTEIAWALLRFASTMRRQGVRMSIIPPSLLQRWLDTPQLLSRSGSQIVLDLLSRQQPGVVVQRYLHRAVAVSSERDVEIVMGGMWSAIAAAEPSAVLGVASRWLAFGFGQSAFLHLLIELLIERARAQPVLIDALAKTLVPAPNMPVDVIDVARDLLDELRSLRPEDRQP